MSDSIETEDTLAPSKGFKFPTAYTILFALIALVALGTWIVPAGQYQRAENAELGREVPIPGTYETVDANPQGIVDVFLAPIGGFYNPDSNQAQAIDVA
ncbi:MAG TPA: C4-dicarboxylate ABC transporter, partial [Hyphomonas adhaerens]|nr:C4-dicarboxylate ABC transporter [Hyphomonas adhaerens]